MASKIKRWSNRILNKNIKSLKKDSRVEIIIQNYDRNDYKQFIKSFDINLAPSKFEGYGLTLLEAMYARVPTITIDPDDAKDFDDAISLRKVGGSAYEVGVHIADVSHYVGCLL